MNKEQLLEEVSAAAQQNQITKEELLAAYDHVPDPQIKALQEKQKFRNLSANALQYVGGSVVFIGLVILVFDNWSALNSFTKILATLGAAVVAYIAAFVFQKRTETGKLPIVFHFLSIVLLPIGIAVCFDIAGYNFNSDVQFLTFEACLLVLYIAAYLGSKKYYYSVPIVLVLTDAFFTLSAMVTNDYSNDDFVSYRFLAVGICYMLLGNYYLGVEKDLNSGDVKNTEGKIQSAAWSTLGVIIVLASILFLGGYRPQAGVNIFWELVYPILIFAGIYYSVYVKKTRILVLCAIFLIFWIFKITAEYFADSLSWPLAIVLAGLLVIGVGYLFAYLNKRYIKN